MCQSKPTQEIAPLDNSAVEGTSVSHGLGAMSVKEAAGYLDMTPGGLRGAIQRGRIPASKTSDGTIVLRAIDVAAYHFYGTTFPDEMMTPKRKELLLHFLLTVQP